MDPLVPTTDVEPFLGSMITPPDEALVALAVDTASALVRSHCRLTISHVPDDVAWLQGTSARRLVLGERPVTAVTAVTLDGTLLDPADYTVRRSGSLWRRAGWGSPESEVGVTYSHGWVTVPADLAAVTRTAAARLASNPEQLTREEVEGYSAVASTPAGFTVGELMVLDRYRRKTWP